MAGEAASDRVNTPRRMRLTRASHTVDKPDEVMWAVEFPNGTVSVSSDAVLFHYYPTLEAFQSSAEASGFTVEFLDRLDHFITIKDNQHRGGAWFIEHGDQCRMQGRVDHCVYTFFAQTHINGSRIYPTGRYRMGLDDKVVTLTPVED